MFKTRLSSAIIIAAVTLPALAQSIPQAATQYPARPVEIYVGAGPGTGADTVARFFAEKLRAKTGQPFTVVNRAGLYGQLAANEVMRATPDSTLTVNPHLVKRAAFDPIKDLTPVTTVAKWGLVLLVNPERTPVRNLSGLTSKPASAAWKCP